jgi:hypothetical protein
MSYVALSKGAAKTSGKMATVLRAGHRSNLASLLDGRATNRCGRPALGTERNEARNLERGHDRSEVDGDAPRWLQSERFQQP